MLSSTPISILLRSVSIDSVPSDVTAADDDANADTFYAYRFCFYNERLSEYVTAPTNNDSMVSFFYSLLFVLSQVDPVPFITSIDPSSFH